MAAGDEATARITAAIADAINAGEVGEDTSGMPGAWAMVGFYYDSDGDRRMLFLNNDTPLHETLGLLDMAQTVWREEAKAWVLGNQRDDEAG